MNAVALRATACEDEVMSFSCIGPDVIHVINAHYGRLEIETCASNIHTRTPNTECLFTGTRDVVYKKSVIIIIIIIIVIIRKDKFILLAIASFLQGQVTKSIKQ